jgi:hypothetical protein
MIGKMELRGQGSDTQYPCSSQPSEPNCQGPRARRLRINCRSVLFVHHRADSDDRRRKRRREGRASARHASREPVWRGCGVCLSVSRTVDGPPRGWGGMCVRAPCVWLPSAALPPACAPAPVSSWSQAGSSFFALLVPFCPVAVLAPCCWGGLQKQTQGAALQTRTSPLATQPTRRSADGTGRDGADNGGQSGGTGRDGDRTGSRLAWEGKKTAGRCTQGIQRFGGDGDRCSLRRSDGRCALQRGNKQAGSSSALVRQSALLAHLSPVTLDGLQLKTFFCTSVNNHPHVVHRL